MNEGLTKDDLRQFGLLLINDFKKVVDAAINMESDELHPEWLKSRKVRKLLDMSPNTLQNLRVAGKVRFKKVLGSYYYSKADLQNLFNEEK